MPLSVILTILFVSATDMTKYHNKTKKSKTQ